MATSADASPRPLEKSPSGPDQALRLLVYELRTVTADWWPFMLYLGLDQWQLKAIDCDHPTVRKKLISALDQWLISNTEASWTDIVSALRRMEEFEVLASRIEEVYCQSGPSLLVVADQAGRRRTRTSSSGVKLLEKIKVEMKDKFMGLVGEISMKLGREMSMERDEETGEETFRQFRMYVAGVCTNCCSSITQKTTIREIFEEIGVKQCWDHERDPYELLLVIVRRVNDSELKERVEECQAEHYSQYLVATRVADHIALLGDRKLKRHAPEHVPDFDELSFKMDDLNVDECSMAYLTDLWVAVKRCVHLPNLFSVLADIEEGCLAVTWLVPKYAVPSLASLPHTSPELFIKFRIVKMTINKVCFYARKQVAQTTTGPMKVKSSGPTKEKSSGEAKVKSPGEIEVKSTGLGEHEDPSPHAQEFSLTKTESLDSNVFTPLQDPLPSPPDTIDRIEATVNKKEEKEIRREEIARTVPPKAVDFIWDKIVVLLCLAILGLTVTDLVVSLLRQNSVQFHALNSVHPPPTVYFTVFLLAHALTIIAPHYIWSLVSEGKLKFFIELVKDLNWLRNLETGQYDARDFEIVRKLEEEYRYKYLPNKIHLLLHSLAYIVGRFDARAFEIVRKLEEEYRYTTIYLSYKIKLLLQLVVSLSSFILIVFYFKSDLFLPYFPCPSILHNMTLPKDWPLNTTIHCIHPSLHYLSIIRYVDMAFVGIAVVFLSYGLLWCGLQPVSELNRKHIAQFVVSSCLVAEDYDPEPFSPRVTNDMEFLLMRLYPADTGYRKVFQDIQIQREINQLYKEHGELLKLFLYSIGEGELHENWRVNDLQKTFNKVGFHGTPDIHIYDDPSAGPKSCTDTEPLTVGSQELAIVASEVAKLDRHNINTFLHNLVGSRIPDHVGEPELSRVVLEMLQEWVGRQGARQGARIDLIRNLCSSELGVLADRVRFGVLLHPFPVEEFPNQLLRGLVQFAPDNKLAMDISFGSTGCSSILAWKFREVLSINFDPYVCEVRQGTYATNITTLQLPPDIWTQRTDIGNQFGLALKTLMFEEGDEGEDVLKHRITFLFVGPMDKEGKVPTVLHLLDKLHITNLIAENAVLLAVRPLKIGSKDVSSQFVEYTPPSGLFKKIHEGQRLKTHLGDDCLFHYKSLSDHSSVGKNTPFDDIISRCGDITCVFRLTLYKYYAYVPH